MTQDRGRRIAITTLGTRGDVQPYLALGQALMARGHAVTVLAPEQFAELAAEHGVPLAPLPGDFLALLDTKEAKQAVAGSEGLGAGFKLLKHMRPLQDALLRAEWSAMQALAPELIVYHPKSIAAPHIAERLAYASILAAPLPGFTPTSAFPSPLLPFRALGPLNRISHRIGTDAAAILFRKALRTWRSTELGLPARGRGARPAGTLYAYSPNVVPVPADWGKDVLVSGYWFVEPPAWEMPADLASFLAAGEPPVYVGFGSMPGLDPERTTATVIDALAACGKRGLLATGGGAMAAGSLPGHVHAIAGAPHAHLFAHVVATVHHGGAGTTGAALRAGKPTTICPHFGDQPFWGRRVQALGVGPEPIGMKRFTVETLSAALRAMDAPTMRARATELGIAIRGEDGLAQAVRFIERRMPV